jgi:hypothetical protein
MSTSNVLAMGTYGEDDVVSIKDIRDMLGRASQRGEVVARSYAQFVSQGKTFPEPFVDLPYIRLWLRNEVEAWFDKNKPKWRNKPSERPEDETES